MPPYSVSVSQIPAGLSISPTGVISGTPLEDGNYLPLNFVTQDSAGNTLSTSSNITIAAGPGIQTLSIPGGNFGTASTGDYENPLYISGPNTGPYTVSLVSGTLPPGLSLYSASDFDTYGNNDGAVLAGGATQPGTYTFIYQIKDSQGNIGQRQVTITVSTLSFMTESLPQAYVGTPYSQALDVRGGTPPYQFSASLPAGLSIDPNSGTISGTPSSASATDVTINVQDSAGVTQSFTTQFDVQPVQITGPSTLPAMVEGQPYSFQFAVNLPGALTWTVTNGLYISGMTLNSSSGLLSGTPSQIYGAEETLNVSVTNGTTAASRSFALPLVALNEKNLIYTVTGLSDVLVNAPAYVELYASGGTGPIAISLTPGSALPPGLSLVSDPSYQSEYYSTCDGCSYDGAWLVGIPSVAGLYTFSLRYTDANSQYVDRSVTLNVTGIGISNIELPDPVAGQPYSVQLHAFGGDETYTFTSLQTQDSYSYYGNVGLTVSPGGLVSGTTSDAGYNEIQLQVCSAGSCTTPYVYFWSVSPGDPVNTYPYFEWYLYNSGQYASLGHGTWGYLYGYTGENTTSETWSISSGTLPPGLALYGGSNLTAAVEGVPTTAGAFNFQATLTDSNENYASGTPTLDITPLNWNVGADWFEQPPAIPEGQTGQPYSYQFGIDNGTPPYSFSLLSDSYLVQGITLSSSGLLSGTPTEGGYSFLDMFVTDASGNSLEFTASFGVSGPVTPPGVHIQDYLSLPSSSVGQAYSFALNQLVAPGSGTPPFTFTTGFGTSLPNGLSIVPGAPGESDTISGFAAAPQNSTVTLLVTDANGTQAYLYSIALQASPLSVSPASGALPAAALGAPYSQTITASGGVPPYVFSVSANSPDAPINNSDMPVGMSLSPAGVLSGTPSTAGHFVLWFNVTDTANNTFLQRYTIDLGLVGFTENELSSSPSSISVTYVAGDPTPAPVPIAIGSGTASVAVDVEASGTWLSVSTNSSSTPAFATVSINPSGLSAGTYQGTVTLSSPAVSNSPFVVPVQLTVSAATTCAFALNPSSATIGAAGGTGSFNLVTTSYCDWSVSPPGASWITLNGTQSGTGSGAVTFTAAPHTGVSPVTTQLTAGGQTFQITQFGTTCGFTISPTSVTIPAGGGAGAVMLTASDPSCAWTAASNSPGIGIANNTSSGSGSGTVQVNVAPNTSSTSLAGTATIAGNTFTVTEAGTGCSFSLSAPGASSSYAGGSLPSLTVTTNSGCAWSVSPGPSWITTTAAPVVTGTATVQLAVSQNSSTQARTATVQIAGQNFSVTQSGVPCTFSLSATNPYQPSAGGSGSVGITPAGTGCPWTASANASWVTLSQASGTDSGTVNLTVAANSGANARSAAVNIAGQSLTVNQSGASCSYVLRSATSTVPATGGSSTATVVAPASCSWTASTGESWITLNSGTSSSGEADVDFTAAANPGPSNRTGLITIAGQNFTVSQPSPGCNVSFGATGYNGDSPGGPASLSFTTTTSGCNPPVQSYATWIAISSVNYTSNGGMVNFTLQPNNGAARSASIVAGGLTFPVTQAANPCTYSLPIGAAPTFNYQGGASSFAADASATSCLAPPLTVNDPSGVMINLGILNNPTPGVFQQAYTISPYVSFINYVRTGQIIVADQPYLVKQSSY